MKSSLCESVSLNGNGSGRADGRERAIARLQRTTFKRALRTRRPVCLKSTRADTGRRPVAMRLQCLNVQISGAIHDLAAEATWSFAVSQGSFCKPQRRPSVTGREVCTDQLTWVTQWLSLVFQERCGCRLHALFADAASSCPVLSIWAQRSKVMPKRRSVHSAGSPSRTPEPATGTNPDGRTPEELPSEAGKKPAPPPSPAHDRQPR